MPHPFINLTEEKFCWYLLEKLKETTSVYARDQLFHKLCFEYFNNKIQISTLHNKSSEKYCMVDSYFKEIRFYKNGYANSIFHRLFKPAIIKFYAGYFTKRWFLDGKEFQENEYWNHPEIIQHTIDSINKL